MDFLTNIFAALTVTAESIFEHEGTLFFSLICLCLFVLTTLARKADKKANAVICALFFIPLVLAVLEITVVGFNTNNILMAIIPALGIIGNLIIFILRCFDEKLDKQMDAKREKEQSPENHSSEPTEKE